MRFTVKVFVLPIAIAVTVLSGMHIFSLITEGEEGRLKRAIYKAKRAAEKEKLLSLPDHISADYHDELGNDRRTLLAIARIFFQDCDKIVILIDSMEVTVEGQEGRAMIGATVYWQDPSTDKIHYESFEFESVFSKDEGRWRLVTLKFFDERQKRLFDPMLG